VSLSTVHARPAEAFPQLLKSWRQKRRLSQLDLALESGVSQRHVSFLESGRAKPAEHDLQLSETSKSPARTQRLAGRRRLRPSFVQPVDDPQMN
jgi:transcriptional regulator with XRE-family HTH domain